MNTGPKNAKSDTSNAPKVVAKSSYSSKVAQNAPVPSRPKTAPANEPLIKATPAAVAAKPPANTSKVGF